MWRTVPDAIDRFPGDFVASLRSAAIAALLLGLASWWLARLYLQRAYPGHMEMLSAAVVVGVLDGAFLGVGAFVMTYAVRVWRYERNLRKRSDDALRRELADLTSNPGSPDARLH